MRNDTASTIDDKPLEEELREFYVQHGFGEVPGRRPKSVRVYTGCMLVPLPNIETRRRYLKYHDLHHLITGYSVGRIGEGEVSAWELGTRSVFASPMLALMNLIALSTGLFLEPTRMWRAFLSGCHSRNLYPSSLRAEIDAGQWPAVASLKKSFLNIYPPQKIHAFRKLEFGCYVCASLAVHFSLVLPAIVARFVTDTVMGGSVFKALKPKKRTDLY